MAGQLLHWKCLRMDPMLASKMQKDRQGLNARTWEKQFDELATCLRMHRTAVLPQVWQLVQI